MSADGRYSSNNDYVDNNINKQSSSAAPVCAKRPRTIENRARAGEGSTLRYGHKYADTDRETHCGAVRHGTYERWYARRPRRAVRRAVSGCVCVSLCESAGHGGLIGGKRWDDCGRRRGGARSNSYSSTGSGRQQQGRQRRRRRRDAKQSRSRGTASSGQREAINRRDS